MLSKRQRREALHRKRKEECLRKVPYSSNTTAKSAAAAVAYQYKTQRSDIYQCPYCDLWHLTTTKKSHNT